MTKKDLITFRPYQITDCNFILATWMKGNYYGSDWFKEIEKKSYYNNYSRYVQKILLKPSVIIAIACLKENPDIILGYSVTEEVSGKNIVHFVYVKDEWRKIGIAKDILPKKIDIITSMTKIAKKLKPKKTVFDPFI